MLIVYLQSFTQEQGTPVQAQEEADPVPQNTSDHELPHRPFTAEEIAQDDLRRERELYGPPTPPRRPRTVASLVCYPTATSVATSTRESLPN